MYERTSFEVSFQIKVSRLLLLSIVLSQRNFRAKYQFRNAKPGDPPGFFPDRSFSLRQPLFSPSGHDQIGGNPHSSIKEFLLHVFTVSVYNKIKKVEYCPAGPPTRNIEDELNRKSG